MEFKIVIGLQFGDEGKGITTDFLCSQKPDFSKIVVRFSGGQQAGHNVKIGDVSHIHSNFGAGTLRGVPSFFSEHCTFYPATIWREKKVLASKGITDPKLYIHPLAKLTTPADVAYNRLREKKLGHGSCGLGIGTTMSRNINTGYKLFAIDVLNRSTLLEKMASIYDYYDRLIGADLNDAYEFRKMYMTEYNAFLEGIDNLKFDIRGYQELMNYDTVIFEGSQGILLDMDHGIFPNVTFANTTSKNALEIIKYLCDNNPSFLNYVVKSEIEIYYITRCYQTRHGAGWMSNNKEIDLINTEDEINVFNEWQTNFRIGEIDYDLINHALRIDNCYSGFLKKNIVITCLDQRPGFEFDYKSIEINGKGGFWTSRSPQSEGIKFVKSL